MPSGTLHAQQALLTVCTCTNTPAMQGLCVITCMSWQDDLNDTKPWMNHVAIHLFPIHACRVPFVQRILHERRAASQAAQSGTDASPSKHVSLSHQPSPVPSPRSPSRASLVPPSGFTTPGRLSRSPSMCPTPKSPGHRLSLLPASTSRCALC